MSGPNKLQTAAECVMADMMMERPRTLPDMLQQAAAELQCSQNTAKLAWLTMRMRGEVVRISPVDGDYPADIPTPETGRRLHVWRLARCGEKRTPR